MQYGKSQEATERLTAEQHRVIEEADAERRSPEIRSHRARRLRGHCDWRGVEGT
jgi:hypothetical protein